ncbi:MAG TPA: peptidylprolyl isomerase, partial [Anaeromyxobacteraceae bacterium]|nr:peptidylprolyl isomerase [Anaeromyxobacteraceae bacterium]
MLRLLVCATLAFAGPSLAFAQQTPAKKPAGTSQGTTTKPPAGGQGGKKMADNIYATFKTSMGDIVVKLMPEKAPKTVENFVGLAEGTKKWTDPRTGMPSSKPLYDGTVFHRVIPEFMIQGGDPQGTGMGGPGYKFEDEIGPDNKFDRPFLLAMANAGPNTNGSQFFITEVPTPHLNRGHTIFGEVVKGQELIAKIARLGNGKTKLEKL